jgi:hypothetical protein
VDGRPVSSITTQFLEWSLEKLEAAGKKVLLLIWDNASWHVSKEVRRWLGRHNRRVKQSGEGVRIVNCLLPKQSPWLNAIEPKWVHAKRKVVEPDGLFSEHTSLPIGCAGSSTVLITSISPFHRRSPDHAPGAASHDICMQRVLGSRGAEEGNGRSLYMRERVRTPPDMTKRLGPAASRPSAL